ncbi:hypothetical protein [Streptomyces sp. NPDC002580]|uniref:hypothetical protein n=1 Tax=Streptomyces sp. NPDC002580 TaxID=3364653 RepID=UPI0036748DE0
MPTRSGPARLEPGRVLRHLDRPLEAHATVAAAVLALTGHHSPRQAEAAAELQTIVDAPHRPKSAETPSPT